MSIIEVPPTDPQAGERHEILPDPVVLDGYNRILGAYNLAGISNAKWRSTLLPSGEAIFNSEEMVDGEASKPVQSIKITRPNDMNTISGFIRLRDIDENSYRLWEINLNLARNLPLSSQEKVITKRDGRVVAETSLTPEALEGLASQIEAPLKETGPVRNDNKPDIDPPRAPSIWQRLSALALRYAHKS